jgi:pilus assembly protein Flp/PilA
MKKTLLLNRLADDDGQAIVEYAFIVALIALVCILALTAIGTNVRAILEAVVGGF